MAKWTRKNPLGILAIEWGTWEEKDGQVILHLPAKIKVKWVARIKGLHPKYGLDREFVDYEQDRFTYRVPEGTRFVEIAEYGRSRYLLALTDDGKVWWTEKKYLQEYFRQIQAL